MMVNEAKVLEPMPDDNHQVHLIVHQDFADNPLVSQHMTIHEQMAQRPQTPTPPPQLITTFSIFETSLNTSFSTSRNLFQ